MTVHGSQRRRGLLCLLLVPSLLSASGLAAPAADPPPPAPGNDPTHSAPSAAAERIYRGSYYRRDALAPAARLFWYERWCKPEAGLERSTHTHHALDGRVVLRQSALYSSDYELSQFESEQRQTGVSARAHVIDAAHVRLERSSGSEREVVVLEHRHPLIVGPTLYGMLLRHWERLNSGKSLVVDFLVIERLDTYAFEIRRVAGDPRTTTFELAANSFLLSLVVSPLRVVFDTRSRQPLRYEGPSPVLMELGKQLESFDARIEYSERAAAFR